MTVDCGTVLPADRRCPGCTVTIEIKHAMTTHVGEEPVCTATAPTGLLPHPCPRCGLAVSAIFAATGRHLLCPAPGAAQ